MRGSVVHGDLIHTDDVILGPALINAHNVESKSAVYPRIVIDPRVMYLYLRRDGKPLGTQRVKDGAGDFTFDEDFDGTYYIDYFTEAQDYLINTSNAKYYQHMHNLIKKELESKDTGIRMKYLWMREKLKLVIEFEKRMQEEIEFEKRR